MESKFKSYLNANENESDDIDIEYSKSTKEELLNSSDDTEATSTSSCAYNDNRFIGDNNQSRETEENIISNIVLDAYAIRAPRYEEEEYEQSYQEKALSNSEETSPEEYSTEASQSSHEPVTPQENTQLINTRALRKEAETYELEKFEKKALIIFNQYEILGYKPRYGTDEDVKVLTHTFEKLGFDVVEHKDYTREQILHELKTFTSQNFVDYGCIAIAVLTHGSSHGLLMAKDYDYSEQVIIEYLKVHNKPTLITKPKMLIIQACRGMRSLKGVQVHRKMGRIHKDTLEDEIDHYTLPIEADMVVVHSTFVGKPANRCTINGSWFIQTLCEKIDLLAAKMDFESIFREVNRTIAIEKSDEVYNKSTQEIDINKQMPMISSSLIRKLFLRKYMGIPESPHDTMIEEPATPITPMPLTSTDDVSSSSPKVPFGTQVTMQYFEYLKNCMRIFVEDNPDDKTAHTLLMVAETFGNGNKFKEPKKMMCSAICEHFRSNSGGEPGDLSYRF